MSSKVARRQRIRELLVQRPIHRQEELQEKLEQSGLDATQATLSRDLRDMGVLKGPAGYLIPEVSALAAGPVGMNALERLVRSQLLAAQAGGNLVVLRTQPGHANPLALEIDRARLAEVMGTIAGDDTVFVAVANASQANRLVNLFRKMAELSS